MKKKIIGCLLIAVLAGPLSAQQPTKLKPVRIADSLSAKELAERNPVLLRKELDSLLKANQPVIPVDIPKEAEPQPAPLPVNLLLTVAGAIILLLLVQLLLSYRQNKWLRALIPAGADAKSTAPEIVSGKNGKKGNTHAAEEKGESLQAMISRLTKENEGLQSIITEHNGISKEYDQLCSILQHSYKIKQYPGNDGTLQSAAAVKAVVATEKALAEQAYEKFLKPLLQLADANKNQPAKMSAEDKAKLVDLLLSLSLLYIEYLYLRVSELSVGGTIVERLNNLSTGQNLKEDRLRKLNRESGSRALVLRLALDQLAIQQLSYPVFEETNLNKG
ncbi:MAG: hypothetical protein KA229_04135 [Chitinophagaceae bacterium]|nr:hypothetical protein [Chitinophagaceae bacterium]